MNRCLWLFPLVLMDAVLGFAPMACGEDPPPPPFAGEKSTWHAGFDRFDYLLDEQTLAVVPFRRDLGEGMGVADPPPGYRRGVVIVPREPAAGRPWSWQACYWNHEPQTEVELVRRGFHVAYLSANSHLRPDRCWDAWYQFLTEGHSLSRKPCFIGMSRGGTYAYTWATTHPDQVAAIYADNPATTPEILAGLGALARADVPLLHVCGSIDPLLGRASAVIEPIYRHLGGRISVVIKDGVGHHPHSLRDPKPLADFLQRSAQATVDPPVARPSFLPRGFSRTVLSGVSSRVRFDPKEGCDLTERGPEFAGSFAVYSFNLEGVEGPVMVAVPNQFAPGHPWVLRADPVGPDSTLDLALLARGFAVVVGPVPFNADGPKLVAWDAVYLRLVDHGFSPKPVLAGSGGAAGEALAWSVAYPDRVACVVAENPVLHARMIPPQRLDDLEPLARAGVPLLVVQGGVSPDRDTQARAVAEQFEARGGSVTRMRLEPSGIGAGDRVEWIVSRATAPGR